MGRVVGAFQQRQIFLRQQRVEFVEDFVQSVEKRQSFPRYGGVVQHLRALILDAYAVALVDKLVGQSERNCQRLQCGRRFPIADGFKQNLIALLQKMQQTLLKFQGALVHIQTQSDQACLNFIRLAAQFPVFFHVLRCGVGILSQDTQFRIVLNQFQRLIKTVPGLRKVPVRGSPVFLPSASAETQHGLDRGIDGPFQIRDDLHFRKIAFADALAGVTGFLQGVHGHKSQSAHEEDEQAESEAEFEPELEIFHEDYLSRQDFSGETGSVFFPGILVLPVLRERRRLCGEGHAGRQSVYCLFSEAMRFVSTLIWRSSSATVREASPMLDAVSVAMTLICPTVRLIPSLVADCSSLAAAMA